MRRYQAQAKDDEALQLYNAEEDVLLGIINWVERTIAEIRRMEAAEPDAAIRENLRRMGDANEWVLHHPARDLLEACQWICWYNMAERIYCRSGAGCQLDRMLNPYYQRSKAQGMTDEEATFLLSCFLLNDPHYYQLGGPAVDGSDNTNALSFLILEAAHRLKSTANLTIRVFDGMDERLFLRGLEILFEDRLGYPRFSGDKALVEGFMRNGYSVELARQRIALGCNWMSLPGMEYSMSDLIKINMAKVFEVAFTEYQGESTEELYAHFAAHMKRRWRVSGRASIFTCAINTKTRRSFCSTWSVTAPSKRGGMPPTAACSITTLRWTAPESPPWRTPSARCRSSVSRRSA